MNWNISGEARKYIKDSGVSSRVVNNFKLKIAKEFKLLDLLLIKKFCIYKVL